MYKKNKITEEQARRIAQRENLLKSVVGNPQKQQVRQPLSAFVIQFLKGKSKVGP